MLVHLKLAVRRFLNDEAGLITAESVLALPVLLWWYMGSYVFFDAYQARNVSQKANYTIADMLSREDASVDPSYVEGLTDIFTYLTAGTGSDQSLRVTLIFCSDECDGPDNGRKFLVDWSEATGSWNELVEADMYDYLDIIPKTVTGERLVLLESNMKYEPVLNLSSFRILFENEELPFDFFKETEFQTATLTALRFAAKIECSTC